MCVQVLLSENLAAGNYFPFVKHQVEPERYPIKLIFVWHTQSCLINWQAIRNIIYMYIIFPICILNILYIFLRSTWVYTNNFLTLFHILQIYFCVELNFLFNKQTIRFICVCFVKLNLLLPKVKSTFSVNKKNRITIIKKNWTKVKSFYTYFKNTLK